MIKTLKRHLFLRSKLIPFGKKPMVLVGWQEWCALPKHHIPAIKAKIDTGAKTSALHASDIRPFHRQGVRFVHFTVHPLQRSQKFAQSCTALVVDQRNVKNSGGHKELRYVIHTPITLGLMTWEIEITLTNRDPMIFRMLLGRDALKGHSLVDPGKFLCQGKLSLKQLRALYTHAHKGIPHL
jgi:ribosomal protein S6--L-glutamate ligase